MSDGLPTTFRVLTKTDNEAAVRVLIPALDSPHESIQQGALKAILTRRSLAGRREILRRLHTVPPQWKEIVRKHHGRMTQALRDAVLGADQQMRVNGCRAAVWFREYDLIPTLLNVLEDRTKETAEMAAETLLVLVDQLYEELAGPRDYSDRRDPQLVRRRVIGSLESSVKRYARHQRREVIETFLLLVGRDNAILKQILQDPLDAGFAVTVDLLSHSSRGGMIRLLLSFLDDPHVPSAALSVVANRSDLKFVRYLLRKIGREPSAAAGQNLKRIESIAWLQLGEEFLEQLDDAAQHGTVQMVMTSGMPRLQAFSIIKDLLLYGKPGGRREAAKALERFSGAEANVLALKALDDPDPQVQANLAAQLRGRGIPGILPRLVEMVDSPHALVRRAARESLAEFSFKRFLAAFDMLDEEVRQSTGVLVKKIDRYAVSLLRDELESRLRTRRLRGLAITRAIDAVEQLEPVIIGLLHDEDHMVRVEAAVALGQCATQASRQALEDALSDSSTTVQEAARKGLDQQAQFRQWRENLSDPRD